MVEVGDSPPRLVGAGDGVSNVGGAVALPSGLLVGVESVSREGGKKINRYIGGIPIYFL